MGLNMLTDPLREFDEILDGKLLGTLREERMLLVVECSEYGSQRVTQHLATLIERSFDNFNKQLLVAGELFDAVSTQPNDGTFDLWRWRKYLLRDGEQVVDVVPRLQQNT